jgi:cytosine/uracil/thiamine/allantoin permease
MLSLDFFHLLPSTCQVGPTPTPTPTVNRQHHQIIKQSSNTIILTWFIDFGRFSKNKLKGPHQIFALPIIGTLGCLTPIFVVSAHQYLYGEFEWYMPNIIAKFNRPSKLFTAASFILATIGNQVAA